MRFYVLVECLSATSWLGCREHQTTIMPREKMLTIFNTSDANIIASDESQPLSQHPGEALLPGEIMGLDFQCHGDLEFNNFTIVSRSFLSMASAPRHTLIQSVGVALRRYDLLWSSRQCPCRILSKS